MRGKPRVREEEVAHLDDGCLQLRHERDALRVFLSSVLRTAQHAQHAQHVSHARRLIQLRGSSSVEEAQAQACRQRQQGPEQRTHVVPEVGLDGEQAEHHDDDAGGRRARAGRRRLGRHVVGLHPRRKVGVGRRRHRHVQGLRAMGASESWSAAGATRGCGRRGRALLLPPATRVRRNRGVAGQRASVRRVASPLNKHADRTKAQGPFLPLPTCSRLFASAASTSCCTVALPRAAVALASSSCPAPELLLSPAAVSSAGSTYAARTRGRFRSPSAS